MFLSRKALSATYKGIIHEVFTPTSLQRANPGATSVEQVSARLKSLPATAHSVATRLLATLTQFTCLSVVSTQTNK
ncbi:MAG: hypothetical protein EAZ30_03685 [Betaproteobacteria bacterium]|nr:MAG: hypothetical protein EAZ30_03685 [Betaproteobacteria bacterium]